MICGNIRNNKIFKNSFIDWIKYLEFEKTYKHSMFGCFCQVRFHEQNIQ